MVRPHIIHGTAAITVILATRIPATTRATSALAGEGTTGLGGGIGTTAGIMADGTGGADAAGTVVAGMAADGTAIIDSESWSKDQGPNVVLARGSLPPPARLPKSTIGLSLNFGPSESEKAIYFMAPERVLGFRLGSLPVCPSSHVLAFVHFSSPGLRGIASRCCTGA